MATGETYTIQFVYGDDPTRDCECHVANLQSACFFAQGIEEDGGSATVTDPMGNVIDHWDGYKVGIVPLGTAVDQAGLVLGELISTDKEEK